MNKIETKINFTKRALECIAPSPKGKRTYYYDTKVRGLGVSVTDKGTLTFIVYRKISGRPERITLGRYPDLSIEQARRLAAETNAQIAQGKNPNNEKSKLKEELTLAELFNHYIERHAKPHKKSWQSDVDQYRLYLSGMNKRKLSSFNRTDIESLHIKVGKNHGHYAANRMLALLAVMFNKAIDWGWQGTNPAMGLKKFSEKSRERFLQGDELPRFFTALDAEPNVSLADFFRISLLTGARRNNVLCMRWQDINFHQATWKIPETKNGMSHLIPLSHQALSILQERYEAKHNEWVFPSQTSKSGHLEEPKSAWKRILQRANLEDLRLHDLRRTLGSWQAATGANSYIIGKSLGHKTQQATAIYARLNIDPVRESVEKATQAMFAKHTEIRT